MAGCDATTRVDRDDVAGAEHDRAVLERALRDDGSIDSAGRDGVARIIPARRGLSPRNPGGTAEQRDNEKEKNASSCDHAAPSPPDQV